MTSPVRESVAVPPAPPDEAERRAALRRMKLVAFGLLVLALAVFIAASAFASRFPWLGYVRATAEASLVGGLADWFAVTALFRHPLGLPIPHTAILQTQKDRVGRILGNFVRNHFLSRAVLDARLAALQPAARAAAWLDDADHRRRLAGQLAGGLARAVEMLPESEVKGFVQRSAVTRLETVQLAPLLGDVLTVAAADGRPQDLLDAATRMISTALDDSGGSVREKVRQESPRWLPLGVRDAIADRIIGGVRKLLADVATDPAHPLRHRFDDAVQQFIDRLRSSPDMIARAEAFKHELLGHPVVEDLVSSVWDRVRRAAERYRADPEHTSLEPLENVLTAVAEALRMDSALRNEVDGFVVGAVAALLEQNRQEVADLIAETVRDWDPEVASNRIELAVGHDLQFIRLNGTLVGGFAGLVIYTVARLFA